MSGEVTSQIELTDSEIIKIEGVLQHLSQKQGRIQHLDGYRREIIERFAGIGLGVNVRVYTTTQSGLYAFDIDITERVMGEFDPDQQVWDVTHDILDLGTKGVIDTKTKKDGIRPPRPKKDK